MPASHSQEWHQTSRHIAGALRCSPLKQGGGFSDAKEKHMCYLDELFGHLTADDHAAIEADKAHRDTLRNTPRAAGTAAPCPKCMGSGRISSFQHIKGGECFSCGGSGLFTRF